MQNGSIRKKIDAKKIRKFPVRDLTIIIVNKVLKVYFISVRLNVIYSLSHKDSTFTYLDSSNNLKYVNSTDSR